MQSCPMKTPEFSIDLGTMSLTFLYNNVKFLKSQKNFYSKGGKLAIREMYKTQVIKTIL